MLNIASINTEHRHHVATTLAFLKQVRPDVMLLQEVAYEDLFRYVAALGIPPQGIAYAPVSKMKVGDEIYKIGIAILSYRPLSAIRQCFLEGTDIVGLSDVTRTEFQEKLLFATVQDGAGQSYRLATTHLKVTEDGSVTEEQLASVNALIPTVLAESQSNGGLLLTGDFNAPRGREAFDTLAQSLKDNIPPEHDSSLDPVFHTRAGHKPHRMVDGFFTHGALKARHVRLQTGVSDHQAVLGEVFYD